MCNRNLQPFALDVVPMRFWQLQRSKLSTIPILLLPFVSGGICFRACVLATLALRLILRYPILQPPLGITRELAPRPDWPIDYLSAIQACKIFKVGGLSQIKVNKANIDLACTQHPHRTSALLGDSKQRSLRRYAISAQTLI